MSSNPPELTLAQQAVLLLGQHSRGALSTFSSKHEGFPFASIANYSVSKSGEPVFFFSSMATHAKNLRANPNAALLITDQNSDEGDMAAGRLTLIGTVKPVDDRQLDEIRRGYLKANPDAAQWADFGDFQFFRLELVDIYFVAGFGSMGWVSPADFGNAHE